MILFDEKIPHHHTFPASSLNFRILLDGEIYSEIELWGVDCTSRIFWGNWTQKRDLLVWNCWSLWFFDYSASSDPNTFQSEISPNRRFFRLSSSWAFKGSFCGQDYRRVWRADLSRDWGKVSRSDLSIQSLSA